MSSGSCLLSPVSCLPSPVFNKERACSTIFSTSSNFPVPTVLHASSPATGPAITGDTVVTGAPIATSVANTPSVPMVANAAADASASVAANVAPVLGVEAPMTGMHRRRRSIMLGSVAVLGVAGVALWITGGAARIAAAVRGDTHTATVAAAGVAASPQGGAAIEPSGAADEPSGAAMDPSPAST